MCVSNVWIEFKSHETFQQLKSYHIYDLIAEIINGIYKQQTTTAKHRVCTFETKKKIESSVSN